MTKFILAGGADRKYESYGQNLAAEISKTVKKPAKVLSCFFAEPREAWEMKFEQRKTWFGQVFGDDVSCSLAYPDTFPSQVQAATVLYLHGGDDVLLSFYMQQYDAVLLFKHKIVVGSSAGANWLSKNFWTCDWRASRKGSGLTDLNIITHYESKEYGMQDPRGLLDWRKAKENFQDTISTTEKITPLPEGKFIVVES